MKLKPYQKRLAELVGDRVASGAEILEVSCGGGATLARLAGKGFRAKGTNYSKHPDTPEGLEVVDGVDVADRLPFEDASFDAVLMSDVIEHLPHHDAALREMARVLRPGGHCFITTPNTHRLASRLHYLLTGFFKVKRKFIGFDVPAESAFGFHNHPPHLPVFLYLLASRGLPLEELTTERVKAKSWILWLLLAPLAIPATFFTTRLAEKNLRGTTGGEHLFRTLTSSAALNGEHSIFICRRGDDAALAGGGKTRLPYWHAREDA